MEDIKPLLPYAAETWRLMTSECPMDPGIALDWLREKTQCEDVPLLKMAIYRQCAEDLFAIRTTMDINNLQDFQQAIRRPNPGVTLSIIQWFTKGDLDGIDSYCDKWCFGGNKDFNTFGNRAKKYNILCQQIKAQPE